MDDDFMEKRGFPGVVKFEGKVNLGTRLRFSGVFETRVNHFCFEQTELTSMVFK